jgi:hypothetical protein
MKAAKNTAEILLDKTVSILPILNARYNSLVVDEQLNGKHPQNN